MTVLGMYVCDVCQIERQASDGGKDAAKRMRCSKEKNIMLHLYSAGWVLGCVSYIWIKKRI